MFSENFFSPKLYICGHKSLSYKVRSMSTELLKRLGWSWKVPSWSEGFLAKRTIE